MIEITANGEQDWGESHTRGARFNFSHAEKARRSLVLANALERKTNGRYRCYKCDNLVSKTVAVLQNRFERKLCRYCWEIQ